MATISQSNPTVPLTKNEHLLRWVEKMAELTRPARIHWVDGSQEEYDQLCEEMVASGTLIRLNQDLWPGCFLARSDKSDVARVEDRTYICSPTRNEAGPTNNWTEPAEMKQKLRDMFKGCMRGRTMYVIPFAIGPLDSPICKIGVQLTMLPLMAHLLGPAEFGLYALALPTVAFCMILADGGLTASLARESTESTLIWSTGFWVTMVIGAALSLMIVGWGEALAVLSHAPGVRRLLDILALAPPIC